ncbi:transposase [Streptomyces samsunensis]|uniref:Transposase n=1 Tax=Streptomyces malaysiensis subsp. samsunensis TaxID=459658 RepID=A0A9X2M413_STRMQ|nr:transposase [Streptomyces samsunensis]MCQ8835246.1 transposase [Streptomyces samsunensis]
MTEQDRPTLERLPAYAPEPNPVELSWSAVRTGSSLPLDTDPGGGSTDSARPARSPSRIAEWSSWTVAVEVALGRGRWRSPSRDDGRRACEGACSLRLGRSGERGPEVSCCASGAAVLGS